MGHETVIVRKWTLALIRLYVEEPASFCPHGSALVSAPTMERFLFAVPARDTEPTKKPGHEAGQVLSGGQTWAGPSSAHENKSDG